MDRSAALNIFADLSAKPLKITSQQGRHMNRAQLLADHKLIAPKRVLWHRFPTAKYLILPKKLRSLALHLQRQLSHHSPLTRPSQTPRTVPRSPPPSVRPHAPTARTEASAASPAESCMGRRS